MPSQVLSNWRVFSDSQNRSEWLKLQEMATLEGILLSSGNNIATVSDVKADPGPKGVFRYTYDSLTFDPSCQGKIHKFETKSTAHGLCKIVSYQCSHE